jgi:lipid II:glycine glycyltransferase (peptidoglycan interpeptide bridge formation enzyme)
MDSEIYDRYSIEVDSIGAEEWNTVLRVFSDASIFQTYEYGVENWGKNHLSHIVLRKDNDIVAASQVWVVELPILKCGFAHIPWGPMWKCKNRERDVQTVRMMLRALRDEYVEKRGLLLRLRGYSVSGTDEGNEVIQQLSEEGFTFQKREAAYRTYRINLTKSLEELRTKFKGNWRRDLIKAERQDLEIEIGNSVSMLVVFSEIYKDMVRRKGFKEYVADMNKYIEMQRRYRDDLKMNIFLCKHEGTYVAGAVVPAIGDTGMYLLGATSTICFEKKLLASHLIQWRVLSCLKSNGFRYYDLRGGIDGDMEGVRHFKSGLSGEEIHYIGSYECSHRVLSEVAVRTGEHIQRMKAGLQNFVWKLASK